MSQYEFTDVPDVSQFNTGLRLVNGKLKPSYGAYRMPIVVTRRSVFSVEVYGQVRPGGASSVAIQTKASRGPYKTIKTVRTNRNGFLRVNVKARNALKLKWRLSGINPETGTPITSREATPRKKLRYYRD